MDEKPHVLSLFTDAEASRLVARQTIEIEKAALEATLAAFETHLGDSIERAVATMLACVGRVVVTGMGKSGHIGKKLAATLSSTGTPSMFMHPGEASHGDLGMVTRADIILALSWSGETSELKDVVEYSKRHRVKLISLTSNVKSSLAQASDVSLILPIVREACPNGLAPTSSSVVQLTVGDAIAMSLLRQRGFTSEDFKGFHPGGKLGSKLLRVSAVMRSLEEVPLIAANAKISDALVQMSKFSLGYVLVRDETGELLGIITDGDLRRGLGPDLLERKVEDVMTPKPIYVSDTDLAGAVVAVFSSKRITAAPVMRNGQVVGGIHMVDLTRHGVI